MYTTATNCLTAITSTIMGEAPRPKEHILCLLPFPEDPKILDRLRQKHNVEFTYKQIFFGVGKALELAEVPDGITPSFPHFPSLLSNLGSIDHLINDGL